LATELSLDRLTRDDVLALASGTLGGEPARELVDALAERASGTPLFVEALLRDLVESGQVVRTEAGWDRWSTFEATRVGKRIGCVAREPAQDRRVGRRG